LTTGNDGILVEIPPLFLVVVLKSRCFFIGATWRVREWSPQSVGLALASPHAITVGRNVE
jgi:hypothetical protein